MTDDRFSYVYAEAWYDAIACGYSDEEAEAYAQDKLAKLYPEPKDDDNA